MSHAAATGPLEPLSPSIPPPIAAALRVPFDPDDRRQALQRVAWATWAVRASGGPAARDVDARVVIAVASCHPIFAAWKARSDQVRSGAFDALCEQLFDAPPARTDIGLAERMVALCGCDLGWTPALGGWIMWDGRRWVRDESETAGLAAMKRTVRTLVQWEAKAAGAGDEPEAVAARKFGKTAQNMKIMRPAVELAKSEPGIPVPGDRWDADPALISVANGTVELTAAGAKLREHRRGDRLTRVARAAYREQATGPTWDRFVREVMPDPKVRAYMQRLAGYALLGSNPHRALVVLLGPTSTGKSTLLEAVVHALGDHAGAFDLGLFRASKDGGAPRADLVDALPRRLIVTTEASDRWELQADAIKRLTGNDTQKARTLYARTSVERRPAFLPIIATNSAPRIVGADTALWRRLVVIPFEATVTREDEHLGERLRTEETDAVLRWMIDGFNAYAAAGLGTPPDACLKAAKRLRADLSLIDAWLADCTVPEPKATEPVSALAQSWHGWCGVNRVPERELISTPALGKQLTARGYAVTFKGTNDQRHRVRTGLRLRKPDAGRTGSGGTGSGTPRRDGARQCTAMHGSSA